MRRKIGRKQQLRYILSCVLIAHGMRDGNAFLPSSLHHEKAKTMTALLAQQNANSSDDSNQRKLRRFGQTVHQKNNKIGGYNADRMWKNNKSIEQMEERLASRWGTDLKSWTAQDNDDDDDEEEESSVVAAGDAKQFRAKPVLDPWQSTHQKKPRVSSSSKVDKETVLARRAQKNQERIRKTKYGGTVKKELDEEDDIDYGTRRSSNEESTGRFVVDDLIRSKPVGGVGTFQVEEASQDTSFFFRKPVANPASNDAVDEEKEVIKDRSPPRERSQSVPLLDGEGNPLYLTLEQAERQFEASLVSSGVDPEYYQKETQDLANRYVAKDSLSWADLGISSSVLLENLQAMGCARPLTVQTKTCSSIGEGKDVLIGTYTGSGKTLSFLVPLVQRILNQPSTVQGSVQAVVVAPGRELASQIVSVARELLENTGVSVMLAIGGTTFGRNLEQIRKRKPTLIVGTPGRIAELVVGQPGERGGRLKINDVNYLVLDECDALLEYKPHRDPTKAILQRLKQQKGDSLQLVMCSATISNMLGSSKLENYLREDYALAMADSNDVLVAGKASAKGTRVSSTVIHGVVHVPHKRYALDNLRRILHTDPIPQQILIFVENSRKVKIVVDKLADMGIIAAPLHGGMGSEKADRSQVSKALRDGYVGIVVTTELAARGIDAPLLTHVINLDLPTDASHYAHRAGRCGRGGRPGVVINMTTSPQERRVPEKFADSLGIDLFAVEPRNGKLAIVDSQSQDLD